MGGAQQKPAERVARKQDAKGGLYPNPKGPCSYMGYTWAVKVGIWEPLWALSIYHIPTWTLWVTLHPTLRVLRLGAYKCDAIKDSAKPTWQNKAINTKGPRRCGVPETQKHVLGVLGHYFAYFGGAYT